MSTDKELRERFERAFADHGYKFDRYSDDQVWGGQYTSCVVESAWEGYQAAHAEAQAEIEALRKDVAGKQARIDALMQEYCPEDMTEDQWSEWGKRQRPVSDEEAAEIDAAVASEVKS